MSMVLMPTPRTSTRPIGWTSATNLLLDPAVGRNQTFLQVDLRLPAQDLAQQAVVRVAATDTLRAVDVLDADIALAGDVENDLCQLVDGDHPVGAQVERLAPVRLHEAVDALDTVVDVTERSRLL